MLPPSSPGKPKPSDTASAALFWATAMSQGAGSQRAGPTFLDVTSENGREACESVHNSLLAGAGQGDLGNIEISYYSVLFKRKI